MPTGQQMKDQILAADDRPIHKEHVPEWGFDVWIRTISGTERSRFVRQFVAGRGQTKPMPDDLYGRLLVLTLSDEQGVPIFEQSDIQALMEKSGSVVDRLFGIASDLNGLSEKTVEDAAKNSDSPQSDDSGSS